ncbi:MAG: M1 family peptidase, partial [Ferruginibacter sp.]
MKKIFILIFTTLFALSLIAQDIRNNPGSNHANRFEQLGTILPTPNEYRTASGAPGSKYWQQRCDYDITCELDEEKRMLFGKETITYTNNSPDVLNYLWLQLDENQHSSENNADYPSESKMPAFLSADDILRLKEIKDKAYGVNITKLTSATGQPLSYTINKTMMRVDLPLALKPGQQYILKIEWNYNLIERTKYGGRGGYENFPEDGNDLFTITQWFPRLCVYSDFQGWQNHQFTGRGEFALVFGNYKVAITVPADHIVMATGECKNYPEVLTPIQMSRCQKSQNSKDVVEIVTLYEATEKEKKRS